MQYPFIVGTDGLVRRALNIEWDPDSALYLERFAV